MEINPDKPLWVQFRTRVSERVYVDPLWVIVAQLCIIISMLW